MLKIFKTKNPKKLFPNAKHVIEHAFTIGGKDYYKFTDPLNIPYERALSCLVYYREVEMNIDSSFLKQHLEAIDKILKGNPIDIFKIKQLNDQLKTRMELPKDPELMYKLASVVYFGEEENEEVYDFEHGAKKIAFWKSQESAPLFFSRMPLRELIPFLEYAEENLSMFFQMIQEVNKAHSGVVSGILSGN